jgi:uncharacterized membrane protein YbhN (UPF0104 family)
VTPLGSFGRSLVLLGLVALVALGLFQAAWQWWGDPQSPSVWSGLLSTEGALATTLCLLSYALRGQRWRLWVAACGYPTPWRQGLRIYLAGYSLTPTPGNVGEAARGLLMRPSPLPVATSVAVFAAERLQDLLALVLLGLPALLWSPFALPGYAVMTLTALVLSVLWLSTQAWAWGWALRWIPRRLQHSLGLEQARQCLEHRTVLTWSLTLLAWGSQGLAVWLMCRHSGLAFDGLQATSWYALSMVAGALTTLPAGLGGTEASLVGLLTQQGVSTSLALVLTLQVRLLTLWLAVAIGLLALVYGWRVDPSRSST